MRGNSQARVDEKGRLKIPAQYREELEQLSKQHPGKFYITSVDGAYARIYPLDEWIKVEEALRKLPSSSEARRNYMTKTSYFGQEVEMDSQGRVLLPQVLREAASLKGDVDVMGSLNVLEVYNHERLVDEQIENKPITPEQWKQLEDIGV